MNKSAPKTRNAVWKLLPTALYLHSVNHFLFFVCFGSLFKPPRLTQFPDLIACLTVSGFYFSPDEPTALIQTEGGPCAVIAPVQAFILKELLSQTDISTWKRINLDNCYQLLVRAFVEILKQAVDAKAPKFSVVFTDCKFSNEESGKRGKWMECVSEISHDGRQIRVGNIAEQDKSKEILPTEMNEECKSIDYDFFHSQLRWGNLLSWEWDSSSFHFIYLFRRVPLNWPKHNKFGKQIFKYNTNTSYVKRNNQFFTNWLSFFGVSIRNVNIFE